MTEWKELAINDYIALNTQKLKIERERAEDPEIRKMTTRMKETIDEIAKLEKPYNDKITNAEYHLADFRDAILTGWDIEDKTFKCNTGSATIRTTKSLIVTDKLALVDRLAEILNNKQKAFDCIRSFDLTTIRKYMDVDLIAGCIAHYDEKRSVIIKEGTG